MTEAVGNQVQTGSAKPRRRLKWFIAGGCGFVLLLAVTCACVWFFTIYGVGGEGANARTAERVLGEFVEALQRGDVESAYQMFVEEVHQHQSLSEFETLLENDSIPYKRYQSLEVCEFQVLLGNKGTILIAQGLLHYEGGDAVFTSRLRKESGVWRIERFHIDTEVEASPWGACKY
jgi:hypothetical protein